jgi:hypothetical protein
MLSPGLKLETSTTPEVSCIFIGRKLELLKKQLKRKLPQYAFAVRLVATNYLGCVFAELEGVLL